MKKFGILQRIRFRDRMFVIYFIGGVIPFIFSSYYTNIQNRNTMLELNQETQTEELGIMRDRVRESMDIVEKVSTKLFINNTIRDVATKRYKSGEEFEEECKKLKIIDDYISDNEVEKYFSACDVVVLPYESATQSGIVQIAYGFEKPVIVTNVGGLPDVVMDGKTGYVVEAKSPMALAEAVKKYYLQNKEEEFEENVRSESYRFGWERMVEKIEMFL